MDQDISKALEKIRAKKLPYTRGNLLLCSLIAYNFYGLLSQVKNLCVKYKQFNGEIKLANLGLTLITSICCLDVYNPEGKTFNHSKAQAWAEKNQANWETLSGSYSQLKETIKQYPDMMDKIVAKDKDWIKDNIKNILSSDLFSRTNNIIIHALGDKSISESDQNIIWDFLEIIVDNIGYEDQLIQETKFI